MAMIGFGVGDDDLTGLEPEHITWGVYHNMGGGFKLLYEGGTFDSDALNDVGDFDRHVFTMRLDF
jgi:hypothetical protein